MFASLAKLELTQAHDFEDCIRFASEFASGFGNAYGIALDAAGNIYVANQSGSTISKVTPGGTVSTFASGITAPQGLAMDSAGNLYATTTSGGQIVMVTPGGGTSPATAPSLASTIASIPAFCRNR